MLSVITLNVIYAECHVLSFANKPIMLSVVMLNVVMLNVVMLIVVMLNVVMLNVVMLNVVMLNVVAPLLYSSHFRMLTSLKFKAK
jgi:hypothetical protein